MAYLSLYRKYRSQTFSDLMGQDHVVRTLQNALGSGRIAHAYLFTGPRGTGKTSSARLMAKALCCEKGPTAEPCNVCDMCVSITAGSCMDVIEMDAASESGIDNVREAIVEAAEYQPSMCRYKIFIIDEVHDLSSKAFDALLKTIEEPPEHVVFVLATTEYNKVPPTIRSRCQKYEFHRATISDLVNRLEFVSQGEGVQFEPAALGAIARMADGAFRDALTLFEQAMLTSDGKITLQHVYDQLGLIPEELVDGILVAIVESDPARLIDLLNEVARIGRDPRSVLESLEYRLADLTRAAYGVDTGAVDATRQAVLHETAAKVGRNNLLRIRAAVAEAHKNIRDVSLPRIWLESELIRLAIQGGAPPVQSEQKASTVSGRNGAAKSSTKPAEPETQRPVVEAAKPEAVAVAEVATEVVSSNGKHSREEADGPAGAWSRVVSAIVDSSGKALALKLQATRVAGFRDNTLYIEFERQIDFESVVEGKGGPARQALLLQRLREFAGAEWNLHYSVIQRADSPVETEAVDLPAEGQKLDQMARGILGSQ